MFERLFVAYGVQIALRVDRRAMLGVFDHEHLPFGWKPASSHDPEGRASVRYDLLAGESNEASYCLYAGKNLVAEVSSLTHASLALAAHAESLVAEHAPDYLFVHAGVVGWEGRAILMPGASFAGKTTLVRAWLDAGATYYSDEFAVLDRAGRVHPFARPLSIRDHSTGVTRRVPATSLVAQSGTTPLQIGLILVTSYRFGARWRPRRLTPGPALLALMRHTVAARGNPAHSMPILKEAVSGGAVALTGPRGEAGPLVAALRQDLEASTAAVAVSGLPPTYPDGDAF